MYRAHNVCVVCCGQTSQIVQFNLATDGVEGQFSQFLFTITISTQEMKFAIEDVPEEIYNY